VNARTWKCQRAGLGEVDLPVFAGGEQPVNHAAAWEWTYHLGVIGAVAANDQSAVYGATGSPAVVQLIEYLSLGAPG
jgi:hypothetical protein